MKSDDPLETGCAFCEKLFFHYGSEEEALSIGIGCRDEFWFCVTGFPWGCVGGADTDWT